MRKKITSVAFTLLVLAMTFTPIKNLQAHNNMGGDIKPYWDGPSDPNGFEYYFDGATWERNERTGDWWLIVYPSEVLRRPTSGRDAEIAFSHLASRYERDSRWGNTDSIRRQFMFSVQFQKDLSYWAFNGR